MESFIWILWVDHWPWIYIFLTLIKKIHLSPIFWGLREAKSAIHGTVWKIISAFPVLLISCRLDCFPTIWQPVVKRNKWKEIWPVPTKPNQAYFIRECSVNIYKYLEWCLLLENWWRDQGQRWALSLFSAYSVFSWADYCWDEMLQNFKMWHIFSLGAQKPECACVILN